MKWHSRVFLIVAFVFYANCMRHFQRTCPLNHRPPNMLMIRKPVGDGAEQMNNPHYSYHALLCIVSQTKHCIHISPCNSHQCIFWNNIQKYSRIQGFPSLEIKELKKKHWISWSEQNHQHFLVDIFMCVSWNTIIHLIHIIPNFSQSVSLIIIQHWFIRWLGDE